jgi:ABC-2 type transport system ATP-binding protein
MSEPAILVEGLSKRFGPVIAVDQLSFSAPKGAVIGLLGGNGAGTRPPASPCCWGS